MNNKMLFNYIIDGKWLFDDNNLMRFYRPSVRVKVLQLYSLR